MKRRLLILVVFLLAGAVVNVTVAWGYQSSGEANHMIVADAGFVGSLALFVAAGITIAVLIWWARTRPLGNIMVRVWYACILILLFLMLAIGIEWVRAS